MKTQLVQVDGVTPLRRIEASTSYGAASRSSQELAGWNPMAVSADAAFLPERDIIVARVRDLVRNDGWAAGSVRRELDNVVGAELRLSAKPDWRALGLTAEWASEFASQVEALWRLYTDDPRFMCDATRHDTMGGLFGQAYRHYVVDGEALAVLLWLPNRGGRYATAVQIIDPDRLSNPSDRMDSDRMRSGVEIDQYGASVAYHIRKQHPFDLPMAGIGTYEWERVPRETEHGRPIVVHFYDKESAGLTRGVARLTPVVERLMMLGKYDKVELQASALNAMFSAFIESPFDHEALGAMLDDGAMDKYQDMRSAFHEDRRIRLGGVRVNTLFPGESLKLQTAQRAASVFADFEAAVLRNIAAGTGLSYEQLSQDWSKTNYSSARAALLETWKTFVSRRAAFGRRFARQIYMAWLEEAIDKGDIELPAGAPDFYDALAAYTRCRWIGPGRGWVDPVKEKQGAILGISAGLSTLENEAAEQGLDYEEVLAQIEIEIGEMPEGVLHPAQVGSAKLLAAGAPQGGQRQEADAEGEGAER